MLAPMSSRLPAGIAVAGQLAFIAAWAVAGAAEPGYSTARQTVSELFAGTAAHPWVMRAGLLALVPSYLAAAVLARRLLAPRGAATFVLLALAAPLVVAVLVNPLDCMTNGSAACADGPDSHYAAAVALQLTLVATPFTAAWALRGRCWCGPALALGALGVLGIAWFSVAGDATHGIAQRAMFGTVTAWIVFLAWIGSRP